MSRIIRTTVLVVFGVIWLLPVYLLLINASKSPLTFTTTTAWVPTDFSLFANMGEALDLSGLGDSV